METRTRIAGIIIEEGKLLMLRGRGCVELWTPGGKIDENETDEECLKRELKEEINVDLIKAKFFKEYTSPSFYHTENTTVQRIYIAEIKGDPVPAAEIDNFVWLTMEDFKKHAYPMIPVTQNEIIPDLIKQGIWG